MLDDDSKFTILLVEDSDDDAFFIERALRQNGIKNAVLRMRDGVEAVQYLQGVEKGAGPQKFPFPEVIILDLKMPRMGGLEFLEWVNQNPQHRVIPTIVLTSSRMDDDVETSYRLGANTFMVKPAHFDELAQMIRKIYDYWAISVKPKNGKRPSRVSTGNE